MAATLQYPVEIQVRGNIKLQVFKKRTTIQNIFLPCLGCTCFHSYCMSINTINTFFCFVFLSLGIFAQGQNYIPETHIYSVEEGLSHRQINDILEDRQGFIWIATPYGLNRFDGYSFKTWGQEDGLQSDQVERIFEDAYGFIWIFYPKSVGGMFRKVCHFSEHSRSQYLDDSLSYEFSDITHITLGKILLNPCPIPQIRVPATSRPSTSRTSYSSPILSRTYICK